MVREGDSVCIGAHRAAVLAVPAHTAGHVAYHLADDHMIFVGDTLFAMGCGRLFEGTAAQMFANMQRLAELPDDTIVYCAHEYTQSNGRFALTVEPRQRLPCTPAWRRSTRRVRGGRPPCRPASGRSARPISSCAPAMSRNWRSDGRRRMRRDGFHAG